MLTEEIAQLLQTLGFGEIGTDIFRGGFSDTPPDEQISINQYGGSPSERVKNRREPVLEKPRFQIACRARTYNQANLQAHRIYRMLDRYSGKISGVHYSSIEALQPPAFLARDDRERPQIICNYEANKEVSPDD